ncbi:hypothetical protein BD413DRAFT_517932 [Trametes elegans]|nr:hypothetical protein BD413DRAFT_517932 [Trametes elegans]
MVWTLPRPFQEFGLLGILRVYGFFLTVHAEKTRRRCSEIPMLLSPELVDVTWRASQLLQGITIVHSFCATRYSFAMHALHRGEHGMHFLMYCRSSLVRRKIRQGTAERENRLRVSRL